MIEGKVRRKYSKKAEESDHASAGKDCSTRGPSETEGGTCGGSDLQCAHPGCEREERIAERVLAKAPQLGCDFIGLQETRRSGKTEFCAAVCRLFCSGQAQTEGRQGLYGFRLAVKESICRKCVYTH